jgi:carbon-monoxide dehydrogenase large subunit
VHGGLAQGIAQALYEDARHDEAGTLTTASFADYLIPSAVDLPTYVTDRTETPSTDTPMGVKGVGEAGTIASTPAVVNAVVDALRPWGVDDIEMPASPQRVWRALRDGESAESSADLPRGTHEMDLEPGGRIAEGEIGPENADPELAAGLPEHDEQHDENGGAR